MRLSEQINLLTIEDYVRLYDQEGPFEIINGERKPIVPTVALHSFTISALFLLLHAYCVDHNRGEVLTETPFVLTYDSNWVRGSRVPDLMFFAQDRWTAYIETTPDWGQKPIVLVPDLVVEVVSPNDKYTDVQQKVTHYQSDGVSLIWVVDPTSRTANVYGKDYHAALDVTGVIDGGDILPGLRISLSQVFDVS